MNALSWLLIWADVLPGLSTALCIAAWMLFIPIAALMFFASVDFFGDAEYNTDGTARNNGAVIALRIRNSRALRRALVVLPILWLVSFLVPDDKETYYAIAASELGEEVIKSPTAGKAIKALDSWLDKQISPEPPADE